MKISIIVPIFNDGAELKKCLDTLVNQTNKDIEIILICDGCSDKGVSIATSYRNKYKNMIKLVINNQNYGQAISRNIGISLATGSYIGFVDSDDFVNINMYKSLRDAALNNNFPDIVSSNIVFTSENATPSMQLFNKASHESIFSFSDDSSILFTTSPSCCNKIFKRSTIKENDFLDLRIWEDFAFTYSKIIEAKKIVFVNENDYFYRKHKNKGVSAKGFDFNNNLLDIFLVVDKIDKSIDMSVHGLDDIKDIKSIELCLCLERINEIRLWNISDKDKEHVIREYYGLIKDKFGDLKNYNYKQIKLKVGFELLEYLDELDNAKKR